MHACKVALPLTRDDNRLVLLVADHAAIGIFGNSEQVRFQFTTLSARVSLDDVLGIEVDSSERIGGNQDDS